jgi:hypothetical protein
MRSDFFYPFRVITRAEEVAATGFLGFIIGIIIFFPILLAKAIIDFVLSLIVPREYIGYFWIGAIIGAVVYYFIKIY